MNWILGAILAAALLLAGIALASSPSWVKAAAFCQHNATLRRWLSPRERERERRSAQCSIMSRSVSPTWNAAVTSMTPRWVH